MDFSDRTPPRGRFIPTLHLMVTPGSPEALPSTMQALGRRYVHYFNRRYRRTGGLFEGRYRSLLVDSEAYLFTCMRYIELNPVRAGIVTDARQYRWSTYHMHAAGQRDLVARPHPLYARLAPTQAGRQCVWRELCGNPVEGDELTTIRSAINGAGALRRARPHRAGAPTLSRLVTGV